MLLFRLIIVIEVTKPVVHSQKVNKIKILCPRKKGRWKSVLVSRPGVEDAVEELEPDLNLVEVVENWR